MLNGEAKTSRINSSHANHFMYLCNIIHNSMVVAPIILQQLLFDLPLNFLSVLL